MKLNDIKQYLLVGASKTVTVYCELCKEYIGYVKTITIMNEKIVRIEYDVYGYDEAGITYYVEYNSFEILINSLQEYIGEDLNKWNIINQSGYYPDKPQVKYDINKTHKLIENDFINDKIILPSNGHITIKEDYWKELHAKKII